MFLHHITCKTHNTFVINKHDSGLEKCVRKIGSLYCWLTSQWVRKECEKNW